jgi:hypothetical protein
MARAIDALSIDALVHIISKLKHTTAGNGVSVGDSEWCDVLSAMRVSNTWSKAVFCFVELHFQIEKKEEHAAVTENTADRCDGPYKQAITFIDAILGRNILITGGPGVGKSFETKKIVSALRSLHHSHSYSHPDDAGEILILAPTHVAANNVNGTTIQSALGYRRVEIETNHLSLEGIFLHTQRSNGVKRTRKAVDPDNPVEEDEEEEDTTVLELNEHFMPIYRDEIRTKCKNARTLIIDEISMVSGFDFELLIHTLMEYIGVDSIAKLKKRLQFILVGDFVQLSPVVRRGSLLHAIIEDLKEFPLFAFQTRAWNALGVRGHELDVNMRSTHVEYRRLIASLRRGDSVNNATRARWRAITRAAPYDDGKDGYNVKWGACEDLAIFPHRVPQPHRMTALCANWKPGSPKEQLYPCSNHYNEWFFSRPDAERNLLLRRDEPDPNDDRARCVAGVGKWVAVHKGGRILVTGTQRGSGGPNSARVFNGTRGRFIRAITNSSSVANADEVLLSINDPSMKEPFEYTMSRTEYTMTYDGGHTAHAYQFTLRGGHASTVHTTQGLTISEPFAVYVKGFFESGHAIVALSRASNPSLMRLAGLDQLQNYVAPVVLNFYKQLRKQSPPSYAMR